MWNTIRLHNFFLAFLLNLILNYLALPLLVLFRLLSFLKQQIQTRAPLHFLNNSLSNFFNIVQFHEVLGYLWSISHHLYSRPIHNFEVIFNQSLPILFARILSIQYLVLRWPHYFIFFFLFLSTIDIRAFDIYETDEFDISVWVAGISIFFDDLSGTSQPLGLLQHSHLIRGKLLRRKFFLEVSVQFYSNLALVLCSHLFRVEIDTHTIYELQVKKKRVSKFVSNVRCWKIIQKSLDVACNFFFMILVRSLGLNLVRTDI